jgi:hypothetical protein
MTIKANSRLGADGENQLTEHNYTTGCAIMPEFDSDRCSSGRRLTPRYTPEQALRYVQKEWSDPEQERPGTISFEGAKHDVHGNPYDKFTKTVQDRRYFVKLSWPDGARATIYGQSAAISDELCVRAYMGSRVLFEPALGVKQ